MDKFAIILNGFEKLIRYKKNQTLQFSLGFIFTFYFLLFTSSIFGFTETQGNSGSFLIDSLDVNQTHIAFTYAGGIWKVNRNGGIAKLLTDGKGESTRPKFSPDGREIAYSNNYAGFHDVHIMSADGNGETKKLTYVGENDRVEGWTPDGQNILFVSHRDEEIVFRLYMIGKNGVLPKALPLPTATGGSFSKDGKRIAYLPKFQIGGWRHYRGGAKSHIRIADNNTGEFEDLPKGNYNDTHPMWIGDKIYFTSDRTGHFNLFSYDLNTKKTEQITKFDKYGITTTSAGKDAIVFVRSGKIHLYDFNSKRVREVKISVSPDKSEIAPKEANASQFIDWILPTDADNRVVLNPRGEVVLFDPKTKTSQNLTNTSGVAERYPIISPDNRRIAYFFG